MQKIPALVGTAVLCLVLKTGYAQFADSTQQKIAQSINSISDKSLNAINSKYSLLQKLIERRTRRMLSRMQQKEADLQGQLQGKDSLKAQQLFAGTSARYAQLQAQLSQPTPIIAVPSYKQYVPGLDSLQTSIHFLSANPAAVSGLSAARLQKIQALDQQLQQLQARWQVASEAQAFVGARSQQLSQQLSGYLQPGQLLGVNKQVYYYQQQLAQYKSMLNNKEKLEEGVLAAVRGIPAFQPFWQKYSMLGQLFPQPGGLGSATALNGLQTKAATESLLKGVGGSVGPNPQYVQQQVEQAQSTLDNLKQKVSALGGTGGTGDMTMPDFTPNSQYNKSFLKRLEYGFNIQNTGSAGLMPTLSTIALTIAYKLTDKATVGIGGSYLMGLGNGLSHISFSNQGMGLRSFLDIKVKGSLWVTGGVEYTYYSLLAQDPDIGNAKVWQKSALIGLTKKVALKKATANIQLLYDLLNQTEIPRGQALKFRIGYSF